MQLKKNESAPLAPIERIRYLMARLRDKQQGCPWDVKQSFQSIVPYTIEEAYEVADAILREDYQHLKEELGDLFFQVVFYCQMAEEEGHFQFEEIFHELELKLVRRHPHVFPDGTLESRLQGSQSIVEAEVNASWEAIKVQEKQSKDKTSQPSILDEVPASMSPLKKAQKLQKAAAKKGFDWEQPETVVAKLHEELAELTLEVEQDERDKISDELGDLMFCCVNLARHYNLDAEQVMMQANRKFERRFRFLEQALAEQGFALEDASLEQMEVQWQQAKRREREGVSD